VVLGGTGLLGAEISRALVDAGDEVAAVARRAPRGATSAVLAEASYVGGDVDDAAFLDEVLAGADRVVYAVGCPFPAESNLDPVSDVEKTLPSLLRVLQAMRRHPGARFTFISSGGTVYGNPARLPVGEDAPCEPLTSYGIMKLTAEHYVHLYRRLYGLDSHVVRISNAYGPTQVPGRGQGVVAAFLAAAANGEGVQIYGDGSIVRDYIHVREAASAVAALANLAEAPPVCNIGSGMGHSVAQVHRIVEEVTGTHLEVSRLPDRGFDVRAVVLDVSRLSSLLEWRPSSLRDGIAATWTQQIENRKHRGEGAASRATSAGVDTPDPMHGIGLAKDGR
jgi:UDP-glucose 4-epimerase